MSRSLRRYEILLPLRFNDGQEVPGELIADLVLQLRQKFGAVSTETQTIHGIWQHDEQIYRDELVRVFVDAADTVETREFLLQFKEVLKRELKQIDIWMTTYPIEVL